ncbi:exopolysaccharide transport family protein [Yoonia sp. F2084L]|uniref:GumC family protein n=1 Tax=Yoonia sp. F2084L TaxID=2926419 RepID=UPI001FF5689C|nr:exopolysaccharide transport family protein [Yoonia sp. F2084L]MCK0096524.1 exopolysaccharide transport family protein [Yoonia sp. F2084L]
MTQHTATVAVDPIPVLDLAGMLRVIWQGKWIIALTTAICIVAGGYYAFRMIQPRFAATAVLQIDVQPSTLQDVSGVLAAPVSDAISLNTQRAMMTSPYLLAQVVDALALEDDPEFNRYLTPPSPLSVNALRRTLRHALAGTTDAPLTAEAIREKTIENLQAAVTVNRPSNTYIFDIRAQSRSAEKAAILANTLATVYLADKIATQDAASQEAEDWLTGRVVALQSQLQLQETEITALIATAQIQENTKLDALSNQVLNVEQQLQAARASLAVLEAGTGVQNSTREQFVLVELRAEIANIVQQRDRLLTQLSTQSTGLVALNQMQRQADATRVLYETYLARLQETRIQRGLETPDSHLVAAATPGTYAGARKTLIVIVSAFVGLLLGLMIVTLRHTYRKDVGDAARLQRETGVPVFVQIARCKAHRPRGLQQRLCANEPLFGRAMQNLRASLLIAAKGPAPKIILSTSSMPNEDSAAYATALAQSFVHAGKSVLLITGTTGHSVRSRMDDILFAGVSSDQAIAHSDILGADTLRLTNDHMQESVLLADGFAAFLNDVARQYDHVIVDGPPVLGSPQTQLLAQMADAVLYSVRWQRTPLSAVQAGLRLLADAGAPATGLILSQVNLRKAARHDTTVPMNTGAMSGAM